MVITCIKSMCASAGGGCVCLCGRIMYETEIGNVRRLKERKGEKMRSYRLDTVGTKNWIASRAELSSSYTSGICTPQLRSGTNIIDSITTLGVCHP